MKSLEQYILEKENAEPTLSRKDIKFTIWKAPNVKGKWIKDNNDYLKIEYNLIDNELGIDMQFLLGFKNKSWQMWVGKIGAVSYDETPYCSLETEKFADAIITALDKCEEIVTNVKDDPNNWVQFYIKR